MMMILMKKFGNKNHKKNIYQNLCETKNKDCFKSKILF